MVILSHFDCKVTAKGGVKLRPLARLAVKSGPKMAKSRKMAKSANSLHKKMYTFYKKWFWPGVSGKTAVLSRGGQQRFWTFLRETRIETRFF